MTTQYNPDESARQIAEAREIDSVLRGDTSQPITGRQFKAAARMRDLLVPLADQLEAAQAEIERLNAKGRETSKLLETECSLSMSAIIAMLKAQTERDKLRAEVEAMRLVVAAAVRVVELDEICDAHPGINDEVGHRAESELHDAVKARTAAVDAYRAARDKAPAPPHETSATIAAWADETFGPAQTNKSIWYRAAKESRELRRKLDADDNHGSAAEECADVVIVLARMVHRLGKDLQTEIDRKMAINRARKWALTGDGHGQHVEEP